MRTPFSLLYMLLFLFLLAMLLAVIQFGIVTMTYEKLGLSPSAAVMLLFGSLWGSLINVPLFSVQSVQGPPYVASAMHGMLRGYARKHDGRTLIAANVGGCIIPVIFSSYLLLQDRPALGHALLGTTAVAVISYLVSRPIAGMGIAMPFFVAPLTAAAVALFIDPENAASLAYIAGTIGVLAGADLLRLRDVGRLGSPIASIGGAGTFDGIFITGIVAVLLT